MADDMPAEFMYQPILTEEMLEEHLAKITDPVERGKEEKRLRDLRRKYLAYIERRASNPYIID
jgi:hypothetical protein